MTLDGFIEGPNKELDWSIPDDELHYFFADLLRSADLLIFGRVVYELMRDYWPNAEKDPAASLAELEFARALNPRRKIVYSKTLENVGWNTQVIREFQPEEIVKLKETTGGYITVSGATLAQEFMRYKLIDEFQLVVMPVAIGNGKPLFKGLTAMPELHLEWTRTFQSGAVVLCYHPVGKA